MKNVMKSLGFVLSRDEQKKIKGGTGTCQVLLISEPGTKKVGVGNTYDEVQQLIAAGLVSRWCCDSCSTASWAVQEVVN